MLTISFTLHVDNVPQEVCQQIVELDWKVAKIIPADCSDTTMKFMFLNDLTDCADCQPDTFPCDDYGTEYANRCPGKGYGFYGACFRMLSCTNNDEPNNTDKESCKACEDSAGKKNRCYLNGTCYLAGEGYDHQRVSETDGTCRQ